MTRRVAVVAGAAPDGSIGGEVAERFVRQGYHVVASDIDLGDLVNLASRHDPDNLLVRRCDVTDEQQVLDLFAGAVDTFGAVDVAVADAVGSGGLGIGLTPVLELERRDWENQFDTIATGAFVFARQAARTMLAAGTRGRIITITSQAAKSGRALQSAYCAAGSVIVGLTQAMSLELASTGITVNAVCAGTIDLPQASKAGDRHGDGHGDENLRRRPGHQIPAGRVGRPADVADAVAYLATPEASFVTGAALDVSGGEELG